MHAHIHLPSTWTHLYPSMHILIGVYAYIRNLCHEDPRQPQTSAILIAEAWPKDNCMTLPRKEMGRECSGARMGKYGKTDMTGFSECQIPNTKT